MYILCLQRTVKRLHLSKVKTSKYYDSGCLVVFYLVSLIWGVNLIAKVGEEQLSNCLSVCLSVTPSVSQYMYVLYSVHLSRVCLPSIFFSLSVYLSVQPVFSRLLHLSFHLSLPLSPLPPRFSSLPPPFPLSHSAGWLPVELVKAVGGVSSQAHEVCVLYTV